MPELRSSIKYTVRTEFHLEINVNTSAPLAESSRQVYSDVGVPTTFTTGYEEL